MTIENFVWIRFVVVVVVYNLKKRKMIRKAKFDWKANHEKENFKKF